MEPLSQKMNAVQGEIDGAQVLVMDFLERCRNQGHKVRVKDMEPVLKAMGLPLQGTEHFILLMADWENSVENGFDHSVADLMDEYPHWSRDIRGHMRALGSISDCRNRLSEDPHPVPWQRCNFLDN